MRRALEKIKKEAKIDMEDTDVRRTHEGQLEQGRCT